jgi:hypothetical protein
VSELGTGGPDSFFGGPLRSAPRSAAVRAEPTLPPFFQPPPPKRNRWRIVVPAVLALVLVAAAVDVQLRTRATAAAGAGEGTLTFAKARPPVQEFLDPTRLSPPVIGPAGAGGYTALLTQGGAPVTWDPCQPIHFVVRPDNEIPSAQVMLDQVIAEVSRDTGLVFVDDGTTTEVPSARHNPYQPARYGKKWAPVLIAWSNQAEDPVLDGDVVGNGGPEATQIGGEGERIVSGSVVFDAPDLQTQLNQPAGGVQVEQVMRHELGHLVGLGHVDDSTQVMNPTEVVGHNGYGAGDLRGLAAMGSGRCFIKG